MEDGGRGANDAFHLSFSIRYSRFLPVLALIWALTGCTPPGPRAVLDGKRLADRGDYASAAERLRVASLLLPTNAAAWSYLGLAYHHLGQVTNAAHAYQRALFLNHDLAEMHFNLGCLWLEQNRLDRARNELTAYVQLRPNVFEGWLRLGSVCLRTREVAAATNCFNAALRLSAQNPDALNGLGLAQLQRNRPREAVQFFEAALKHSPDFRPALLNLAIVSQQYLNDRATALRVYRQYLALTPRDADWAAVNAVAQALEPQPAPPPRPAPTNAAAPPAEDVNLAKTPITTAPRTNATPKTGSATNVALAPTAPAPAPVATQRAVEVVQVPPAPVIRTTPDASAPAAGSLTAALPAVATTSPTGAPSLPVSAAPAASETSRPAKRSFLSRMNPLNLFRSEAKPPPRPTPLPASGATPAPSPAAAGSSSPPGVANAGPPSAPARAAGQVTNAWPRYAYRSPPKPAPGDPAAAARAFAQGTQALNAGRLAQAAQAFGQAAQLDPASFEAQYSLGLVLLEQKNYGPALAAYETALALRPDSADARYNFALSLKAANYPLDAAVELRRLLAARPNETRAHLALANLYAEQLRQTNPARQHYLRVLELDPHHPAAADIRFWLAAHPG